MSAKSQRRSKIDWAVRSTFEAKFPAWRREQIRMENEGIPRTNNVEIPSFNLKTPFKDRDLFVSTSLTIPPNKRCAVYGVNGSGKTCLFEAINNGEISGFPAHLNVHHMKELEHDAKKDEVSVLNTVLRSHSYRNALLACEVQLKKAMEAEEAKSDAKRMAALKENYEYVLGQKAIYHGEKAEANARAMLRVLGFDEVGEQAPLSSLSGGLRMRVALACAFFINPDILLLDEPTNHLDLPSVLWLENKLRAYKGSYLLVTHDRVLLENVVTSVLLIRDLKLVDYSSTFASFEKEKEKEDKAFEKKADDFLRLNRNLSPSSPKYRLKRKYEDWTTARQERKILLEGKFTFTSPPPLKVEGDIEQKDISLIKVEDMTFSYNPETLPFIFSNPVSYEIKLGSRLGVMGPNGAGKSTFLKLITNKLKPTTGSITRNPDFVTAYFGQHSTKELDLQKTPLEFMQWKFPKANVGFLRSHLAKTSVGDSISESRMVNLSFSQRSCVIFAALTYVPPHLLIMDEPTNFLDLDSVDSLIKAVNKFNGGLVVVTHNRDFLKRTVKTFLSIIPGQFLEFPTMKEAERATYSFISALESGQSINAQTAILNNRGGGAIHTDDEQAARAKKLEEQQRAAKEEADKIEAEKKRLEEEKAAKEAEVQKKRSLLKDDWKVGESAWANHKGAWIPVKVSRVTPFGVSYQTSTGAQVMTEKKKLRTENPIAQAGGGDAAPQQNQKKGNNTRGGKGGRGGRGRGNKGGNNGGRGGNKSRGRGGRGGRGGNKSRGRGRN